MPNFTFDEPAIATDTANCDRIFPVLTAPEVFSRKLVGHRFLVELVSRKYELLDDRAIPVSTRTIDVVVTQPTFDAIASLIAACSWLKGYSIVSYSEPSFDEAPF
ncbi:hypothetical protein [Chroococcidiopsis sp. CCNUC1]|uniref:hypothetical protein n=1 Tax=Chroococcidiopsis sp. CCNUC1 TaxID=2653189 RepID=UPI0020221A44|nr:hypothetical protein [Chroococcidiopsis sp. CCNUC1]URD53717.1 hypothetical protein M5J74_31975 [Chroococcidiopsis sp. CCNUC1]